MCSLLIALFVALIKIIIYYQSVSGPSDGSVELFKLTAERVVFGSLNFGQRWLWLQKMFNYLLWWVVYWLRLHFLHLHMLKQFPILLSYLGVYEEIVQDYIIKFKALKSFIKYLINKWNN